MGIDVDLLVRGGSGSGIMMLGQRAPRWREVPASALNSSSSSSSDLRVAAGSWLEGSDRGVSISYWDFVDIPGAGEGISGQPWVESNLIL